LGTHTDGTDVVTIVTRENGWSIEGPIGANLDTIQAGGTINITAAEVCKFTIDADTSSPLFYFCYDGVCGSTTVAGADPVSAIGSIKDDNGNAIIAPTTAYASNVFTITMPIGKSCDGLEMRAKTLGDAVKIVKTTDKNNNGKVFKITRSFLKIEQTTPGAPSASGAFTFTGGAAAVVQHAALSAHDATVDASKCDYSLRRYVITLDTMPTASAYSIAKTLLYKSPVGSCNVAETTKGTFESYECSNRGACDGKSGLCACYEGYSGESCQTQTVLV